MTPPWMEPEIDGDKVFDVLFCSREDPEEYRAIIVWPDGRAEVEDASGDCWWRNDYPEVTYGRDAHAIAADYWRQFRHLLPGGGEEWCYDSTVTGYINETED